MYTLICVQTRQLIKPVPALADATATGSIEGLNYVQKGSL